MRFFKIFVAGFFIVGMGCSGSKPIFQKYSTNSLQILRLSEHTYQHLSYLPYKGGMVDCNGMIVISDGEAVIIDTPTDSLASEELIQWVETTQKCKIVGVVPTHFHEDCLGGLEVFHSHGISSFANNATIELASQHEFTLPKNGVGKIYELKVGGEKLILEFVGEGHTVDNIVAYFPSESVLFGGCLVKTMNAGKGNLNDANVDEWSNTVTKVKHKYQDVKIVVPGHGTSGGIELLDYTIDLFRQ